MMDPMAARNGDPTTSQQKLDNMHKDSRFKDIVYDTALELGSFTDTTLTLALERRLGVRQQRNVVARTRLTLEREDKVERLAHMTGDRELTFVVLV